MGGFPVRRGSVRDLSFDFYEGVLGLIKEANEVGKIDFNEGVPLVPKGGGGEIGSLSMLYASIRQLVVKVEERVFEAEQFLGVIGERYNEVFGVRFANLSFNFAVALTVGNFTLESLAGNYALDVAKSGFNFKTSSELVALHKRDILRRIYDDDKKAIFDQSEAENFLEDGGDRFYAFQVSKVRDLEGKLVFIDGDQVNRYLSADKLYRIPLQISSELGELGFYEPFSFLKTFEAYRTGDYLEEILDVRNDVGMNLFHNAELVIKFRECGGTVRDAKGFEGDSLALYGYLMECDSYATLDRVSLNNSDI